MSVCHNLNVIDLFQSFTKTSRRSIHIGWSISTWFAYLAVEYPLLYRISETPPYPNRQKHCILCIRYSILICGARQPLWEQKNHVFRRLRTDSVNTHVTMGPKVRSRGVDPTFLPRIGLSTAILLNRCTSPSSALFAWMRGLRSGKPNWSDN